MKHYRSVFLSTVAGLLLNVASAYSFTFYVNDTGGDDARSCETAKTVGTPKKTIAGATGGMECASAGDTVFVAAGTYVEFIESNLMTLNSGSSGNPITLEGASRDTVIIRPGASGSLLKLNSNVDWWYFKNFTLDGRNMACGSGACIGINFGSTASNNVVENVLVRDVANNGGTNSGGQGIAGNGSDNQYLDVEVDGTHLDYSDTTHTGSHCVYLGQQGGSNNIIDGGTFHNCGEVGIQFNAGSGTAIATGNIVRHVAVYDYGQKPVGTKIGIIANARQSGMLIYDNLIGPGPNVGIASYGTSNSGTEIYNNTVYANDTGGMSVGTFTAAVGTIIKNNLLSGNGSGIHIYAPASNTVLAKNNIYNHATPVINSGTNTTQDAPITGNPLLVNPGARDFHLQAGSPAIDAGENLSSIFDDDYAGTTRTVPFEIGAYNFGTTVAPNHLSFLAPPVSGTLVNAELPDVIVEVLDAASARQTADTGNCVAAKATGTGTLGGTLTRAVSSGLCTFDNLTFDAADTDFSITVTKSGGTAATEVTSLQFSVVAAPSGQGSPTLILRQY